MMHAPCSGEPTVSTGGSPATGSVATGYVAAYKSRSATYRTSGRQHSLTVGWFVNTMPRPADACPDCGKVNPARRAEMVSDDELICDYACWACATTWSTAWWYMDSRPGEGDSRLPFSGRVAGLANGECSVRDGVTPFDR